MKRKIGMQISLILVFLFMFLLCKYGNPADYAVFVKEWKAKEYTSFIAFGVLYVVFSIIFWHDKNEYSDVAFL